MSFSPEWEHWYAEHGPIEGWYPTVETLLNRYVVEANRVLELGSGSGGCVSSVLKHGWPYFGVDGSESAVASLHARFPDLRENIVVGDFTRELPFGGGFDLILDRASVAHNDTESIRRCVALVFEALNPGGLFISSDWFSTWHSEYTRGDTVDAHTRSGYADGQFIGVGNVHFSDLAELFDLFSAFEGIHVEQRITQRPGPNRLVPHPVDFRNISRVYASVDYRTAVWDIVVRKPK